VKLEDEDRNTGLCRRTNRRREFAVRNPRVNKVAPGKVHILRRMGEFEKVQVLQRMKYIFQL